MRATPGNTRALAAFLALCAVNFCVGADAAAAVAQGVCTMQVSSGDAAVGIKIVTDESCSAGGLGCINSDCRFCKVRDTPQSGHLYTCDSIRGSPAPAPAPAPASATEKPTGGTLSLPTTKPPSKTPCPRTPRPSTPCPSTKAPTPTPGKAIGGTLSAPSPTPCPSPKPPANAVPTPTSAATPATTSPSTGVSGSSSVAPATAGACPVPISPSDVAVGIQLIRDESCVNGGVGCVYDVCRFCKVRGSLQSAHLNRCSYYGLLFPGDDGPANGATPVTSPPVSPAPPPIGDDAATCSASVPKGDAASGIDVVTDASCAGVAPPVGCFDDACRYCKVFDSSKSFHLLPCPNNPLDSDEVALGGTLDIGPICTTTASDGDRAVGIEIVAYDCASNGGVGCIDDTCRFCRARDTPASMHLDTCASVLSPLTPAPAVPTAAPESGKPLPAISMTCGARVTSGDYNVGIDIYTDVTCVAEGVGCFQEVCRYCKRYDSPQSIHFPSCSSIDTKYGTDIAFVLDPSVADATFGVPIDEPTSEPVTPAPVTPAPVTTVPITQAPATTKPVTQAPTTTVPATQAPATTAPATRTPATAAPVTSAPVTTAPPVTSVPTRVPSTCASKVSFGDSQVGISAFNDATCVNGGIGCFEDVCRYCRTKDTVQARNFVDCPAPAAVSVHLAATSANKAATGLEAQVSAFMASDAGKRAVEVAACVGVVAVVALLAVGTKRAVRRVRGSGSTASESETASDSAGDTEEADNSASVSWECGSGSGGTAIEEPKLAALGSSTARNAIAMAPM